MAKNYIPCDTVGDLYRLLAQIPADANLLVNGKKAVFSEDANTWTVYLDQVEDKGLYDLYGF